MKIIIIGLRSSWNDVGNFFYNIGESFITSVEAEVGAVGFLAKKEVKKFTFSIGSGVGFTIGYSR